MKAIQCHTKQAHSGSTGIALPKHNHRARKGWLFSAKPRPLWPYERDSVSIVQDTGWALGMVYHVTVLKLIYTVSRDSVVEIKTGHCLDSPRFESRQTQEVSIFSKTPIQALGPPSFLL